MQDKSVTTALLPLRKTMNHGEIEGLAHVEALLTMCDLDLPRVLVRCATVEKRGHMRRMVLDVLTGC